MAPSDDRGHLCARSRLDPLFGLCVCKVRTPRPLGAGHTWGRDVREVTQAIFRSMVLAHEARPRHISGGAAVSLDSRRQRSWVRKGTVAALPDDADRK